jgi:hypothetical protein
METTQKRLLMIHFLEGALKLAEEVKDSATAYLTERALDEARAQQFSGLPPVEHTH